MEDLFMSSSQGDRPASEAALGILGACSEVVSRWFSVMRGAVMRERSRQERLKEDNGLPRSAKIPYAVPPLTDSDMAVASLSESVIRAMFGDSVADYASAKFRDAVRTGDMRAFKIRLVILKARDSIRSRPLKEGFSAGAEQCIDDAETKAGCKQEHSPRRLSKKEQERKKRLDRIKEARLAIDKAQMELPLIWTGTARNDITHGASEDDADTASQKASHGVCDSQDRPDTLIPGIAKRSKSPINARPLERCPDSDDVTVTHEWRYSNAEHGHCCNSRGIVRKSKTYGSVEDILNDIDDGAIVPYESQYDIISDMEEGFLTPEEAVMFAVAMDRCHPEDADMATDGDAQDEGDDDEECEDDMSLDDEDEEDGGGRGTGFSYNPNGFGGCENGEDEW